MKYIITENQYISLVLRRRLDRVMNYIKTSYEYLHPCELDREYFVYSVAWNVGNEFFKESFTGNNTLSDIRGWVEDNLSDELLKHWDEKCGVKKKYKVGIFSESKLDDVIYKYLTSNYHPDYNWGPSLFDFYKEEIERNGYYDFEIEDWPAYSYVGKNGVYGGYTGEIVKAKTLLIEPDVWKKLDKFFGNRWEPVFVKWFEDNSDLPVEQVIKYGEAG